MRPSTIAELKATLKASTDSPPTFLEVLAQAQSLSPRSTKTDKKYLELALADSTGHFSVKIWEDARWYQAVQGLTLGEIYVFKGSWSQNTYGIEARDLSMTLANPELAEVFYQGDPALCAIQDQHYQNITEWVQSIQDPRLLQLCLHFLEKYGDLFKRTAAAKRNHHARRGGLVEHVGLMMASAVALSAVYTELNRDLLIAGVLFHDVGKLWENSYPEKGFNQNHSLLGEFLGHIPIGIEFVNTLWRDLNLEAPMENAPSPSAGPLTRMHLLHLIGSHHGEYEFGSPVLPKTPEAFALHYIDNLDAKLEMLRSAYAHSNEIAPQIYERVFPLPSNLIKPLPPHTPPTI